MNTLKLYHYTISTGQIWTSFDTGLVEAMNLPEAIKKATEEIQGYLDLANEGLKIASKNNPEIKEMSIEMDYNHLKVELYIDKSNTILLNNKLISKFQYPNWVHPKNYKGNVNLTDGMDFSTYAIMLVEDYGLLRYQSSWNALLPVVQKVLTLDINNWTKDSPIWKAFCALEAHLMRLDLDLTYTELIAFIHLYNVSPQTHEL